MTIVGPMPCKGCGERVKVSVALGRVVITDEWLDRPHRCLGARKVAA